MSHNAISTLHLSNGTPSTPTPQPHQTSQRVSKAILKTAIQKANSAVVLDKANDLTGAIEAYTEAVNLLDRVLSTETRENDRQRLQETYDKYLKRIQYLTTLRANTSILHDTIESNHNKKEENGKIKAIKNNTLGNQQQINTATRQSKGQYSKWVRKMASSSSLDSKSSRLEIEINSSTTTIATTNTNTNTRYSSRTSGGSVTTTGSPRWQQNNTPSSPISLPLDAPPSPVSSKSTPSRPISNKKSNDTLNPTSEPPPPLEPRSVYRPNPRKSSRSGAAAALQHHFEPPSTPATPQQYHHERKTSLSSISSSSSEGSDHIGVPNSQQPSMALPSLLATKMEVSSATSIQLDNNNNNNNNNNNSDNHIIDNSSNTSNNDNDNDSTQNPVNDPITNENNIINNNNNNNNKQNEIRHSSFKFSTPSSNNNEEINNNNSNSNSNVLGRLRTSSLPRKLQFSRTNSGSSSTSRQRQLSESNDSTSTTSSSIPMRRNVTQPSVTMPSILSEYQDTATTNIRSSTVQRQSSGLSMRKKYNRQSRTSMDKDKSSSSGGGGSGPMFSHFFGNGHHNGISKEFNAFSPTSTNRSSDDNLEYFGNNQNSSYDSDSTNTTCSSSLPDHNQQQQQSSTSSSKHLENHLKLIMALESSMNYGGYITPKLFIPKNLWHHNNIRLPSMDVKVAACESLILDLNRIEKWKNLDDIRGSLRLIESLEEVVEGLQVTLSKKLKRDSLADTTDDSIIHSPDGGLFGSTNNHNSSSMSTIGNSSNNSIGSSGSSTISNGSNGSLNKRTQFMSWGSKLSKSVERMNAFSLTKVEDQHRHYIEVLQKLFIKLHLLEMWFQHYLKKDRQKNPHYDTLLSKLGKVCEGINRVVGGFVLRDVAILLGKWLKRGGTWVNE